MSEIIYLDNNATTKIDGKVLEAMLPYLEDEFFNPSSLYAPSKSVKKALGAARQTMAKLLGCQENEIVFTSGGSESNVTAIMGLLSQQPTKKHIVCSSVEHASILETMNALEKRGYKISYLSPDGLGRISEADLEKAITKNTALVCVMLANNEIGNIYPIKRFAEIAHKYGAAFHTDGVQAVGKIKVDVSDLGVDTLSLSGHKFYAPKGVGALYVRGGNIEPLVFGHQERNLRGGTENVAGIVAMAEAANQILLGGLKASKKICTLRDSMEKQIAAKIPDAKFYGDKENRICNTSCVAFKGIDAHELMFMLESMGILVSTGSACNSESAEPSHVLLAIGADMKNYPAIRVSLSKHTTKEEISAFVKQLEVAIKRLRR